MSNIWHDINPNRINPDDFIAVIEIEKGSIKKLAILSLIEFFTPRHTTRQTTGLSLAPMLMMETLLMYLLFVARIFIRLALCTAILSALLRCSMAVS